MKGTSMNSSWTSGAMSAASVRTAKTSPWLLAPAGMGLAGV
jgi:hypothetical protein